MNDAGIKVSIIIPVYNGANYLREAIDSALAQTYHNIEIIVVNDGSDDEGATERIALSYGDRIRYFAVENGGVSSALNFGIAQMTGEWFSWLSHDDLYLPERIQLAVEKVTMARGVVDKFIVLNKAVLIGSDGKKINRPLRRIGKNVLSPLESYRKLAARNNINGCAVLVPKKAFTEAGLFCPEYRYIQDTDLWIRLILSGYSFVILNRVLTKTRIHAGQVSQKTPELFGIENERMGLAFAQQVCDNIERFSDFLFPMLEADIIQKNSNAAAKIISWLRQNHKYLLAARLTVLIAKIKMHAADLIRKWLAGRKPAE